MCTHASQNLCALELTWPKNPGLSESFVCSLGCWKCCIYVAFSRPYGCFQRSIQICLVLVNVWKIRFGQRMSSCLSLISRPLHKGACLNSENQSSSSGINVNQLLNSLCVLWEGLGRIAVTSLEHENKSLCLCHLTSVIHSSFEHCDKEPEKTLINLKKHFEIICISFPGFTDLYIYFLFTITWNSGSSEKRECGRSEMGLILNKITDIKTLLEIKWYCFVKQQDNNTGNHISHSGEFSWN